MLLGRRPKFRRLGDVPCRDERKITTWIGPANRFPAPAGPRAGDATTRWHCRRELPESLRHDPGPEPKFPRRGFSPPATPPRSARCDVRAQPGGGKPPPQTQLSDRRRPETQHAPANPPPLRASPGATGATLATRRRPPVRGEIRPRPLRAPSTRPSASTGPRSRSDLTSHPHAVRPRARRGRSRTEPFDRRPARSDPARSQLESSRTSADRPTSPGRAVRLSDEAQGLRRRRRGDVAANAQHHINDFTDEIVCLRRSSHASVTHRCRPP